MRRRLRRSSGTRVGAVVLGAGLLVSACTGGDSESEIVSAPESTSSSSTTTTEPATTTTSTTEPTSTTVDDEAAVREAHTKFLVDLFERDEREVSSGGAAG